METPEEGEEWADTEDIASGGHRSQGCHRGLVLEGHNTTLSVMKEKARLHPGTGG